MNSPILNAIRAFEGFTPQAQWDYAQFSNGYGTRAKYAGEVIDKAEADRRFEAAVANAKSVVERHAPRVDEGTKAALTSLTFNAGETWVTSGLGEAVKRGDLDAVRSIFVQYNKAGGEVLPGLVSRRAAEALWIGNPELVGANATEVIAAASASIAAQPQNPESAPITAAMQLAARGLASGPAEGRPALGAAAVEAAQAEGAAEEPAPVITSKSFSDLARLVQLDNGHELLKVRSGQGEDRDGARKT
jgi:lysozyme